MLQDSILLRRRFPGHSIWCDPLFTSPEYLEFAERVDAGLVDGEEPYVMLIEKAHPLIANELQTLSRTVTSAEASIRLEMTRQQRSMAAALQEQRQLLEGLS